MHTSRAGEARSRHTTAVVPRLVPGTQCPSRLKVLPLRGGAFATGGDGNLGRRRPALIPLGSGERCRGDHLGLAGAKPSAPGSAPGMERGPLRGRGVTTVE